MTQLAVYLLSMGLVVLGALAFISALNIPGRVRMGLACLAACVPAAAGVWIFHSSGLKIADFGRLLRSATADIQRMTSGFKENQNTRREFEELLEQQR